MELSHAQAFHFKNLKILSRLTDTVDLCLYEHKCKLYITKRIAPEDAAHYEIISGIDHPNLAKIEYIADTGEELRAVREYISGDCLADIIESGKTLSERRTAQIAYEIASGLNALHMKSIVHRDINPNNIIISSDGIAKIIDYGIARSYKENKSKDTVIIGTPGYAAPEQFGFTQSDGRTDVYAMGVLMNVMMTGKTPTEKLADGSLKKIISKCIEIDSKKRYANMVELMRELQRKAGAKERNSYSESSDSVLDKIIDVIPGIRTKKPHFIIISLIWYIFGIFSLVGDYIRSKTLSEYLVSTAFYILVFILPLFCFHNFLDVWDRLPLTKSASRSSQKVIFYILGVVSILFGFYIFGITFGSPE